MTFALDMVLARALYHFLKPVNRAVSPLAAWFRLAYAAIFTAGERLRGAHGCG